MRHTLYLCEYVDFPSWFPFMELDDPVNNRYIPAFNVEHYNLSSSQGCRPFVQEEDIAPVKRRLHATTQDNNHLDNVQLCLMAQLQPQAFCDFLLCPSQARKAQRLNCYDLHSMTDMRTAAGWQILF